MFFYFLVVFSFFANQHQGFIMDIEGDVRIFRSLDMQDTPKEAVNVMQNGIKGKMFPAKVYNKIYSKDTISTGENAKAKLVLANANTLMIGPFTNFTVEDTKKEGSSFALMYGKIRSIVKQDKSQDGEFKIQTPTSVIGVRGTDFYTVYRPQNGKTTVTTLSGVVSIKNLTGKINKEVLVSAGYSSHVLDVSRVDIKALKETLKVEDIDAIALPTSPVRANSIVLEEIQNVSTIDAKAYKLNRIDSINELEAIKSQNKVLELMSTDSITKDIINIDLNKLIKEIRKEEEIRQQDSKKHGVFNKLEQWIMSY